MRLLSLRLADFIFLRIVIDGTNIEVKEDGYCNIEYCNSMSNTEQGQGEVQPSDYYCRPDHETDLLVQTELSRDPQH